MEQQIQAKFGRVAKSPTKNMLKIVVNGQEQWADCTPQVKGFAGKAFQEGHDVVLTASYANNRYNVSRIESASGRPQAQAPVNTPPVQQTAPVQTAKPAAQHTSTYSGYSDYQKPRIPEESERMTRLSVLSSVCEAVAAIPGQVDVNVLWDVIESGYNRLLAKVKE